MMSDLIIRKERQEEAREVEELVRDAFWDKYMPGCSEHLLTHKMRTSSIFIPELSFVAEKENKIVGMICYTKGKIETANGQMDVLSFGPVAVLPVEQGKGIGSQLINHSLNLVKKTKAKAVVIYGDFDYYKRFGFEHAESYGLKTSEGFFDALLVLKLDEKTERLDGVFVDEDLFNLPSEEVKAFDASFPKRQKHKLPTQIFDGPLD
ncbi:MAG: N-acetyltransferase [Alphaproteobacteria bacterium]|nr:N-acetyltransferase [Alphaproteobacteria bacterium]